VASGEKSSDDILHSIQVKSGEKTAGYGINVVDVERIPSGVFPFDLATGGGWPRGRLSICGGPPSAGKTNLILKTIGCFQKLYPDLKVAFFDLEHALDGHWAKHFGIDVDKLIVVKPDYGEQAVDFVLELLDASDMGLIVVDTLAHLTPMKELETSAEKMTVAGASLLIGQLIRRATVGLLQAEKHDRYPTVIGLNQIRYKIGVMYGDPEKMPGGMMLEHASGLTVRVFGKDEFDKAVHSTLPVRKETKITIKKWKVPIIARNCEYKIAMLPHGGNPVGFVDDWNTLGTYLRDMGWLEKVDKNKWKLLDHEFKTLSAAKEFVYADPEVEMGLKQSVIELQLKLAYAEDVEVND
jgi:recombination protein RecA